MLGKRRPERMEASSMSLEVLSQAATLLGTESTGEISSSSRYFKKRAIASAPEDGRSAPAEKVRKNGVSELRPVPKPSSVNSSDSEDDEPLDMSNKSGTRVQVRPSVITCAFRTQCHLKEASRSSPQGGPVLREEDSGMKDKDSSMCDPVIDEHFRRSLGKDYADLFDRNGSNSVSVTVDDHFAKALGDTWLHLQKQTSNPSEGKSTSGGSASVLPQPQGVVS